MRGDGGALSDSRGSPCPAGEDFTAPAEVTKGSYSGTVPLSRLIVDPSMQVREQLNGETVRRYAEAMRQAGHAHLFPPVQVAIVGDAWYLTDGFHRAEAARQVGLEKITAEARPAASIEEARWRAAVANLRHGLPLRKAEVREAFRRLVRAGEHRLPDKEAWRRGRRFASYREIAAALGGIVSHRTLVHWMNADFPAVARAMREGREDINERAEDVTVTEERRLRDAIAAIEVSLANAQGITSADRRALVAAALREAAERIEQGQPWTPGEEEAEVGF